jgi:hypothetical protein
MNLLKASDQADVNALVVHWSTPWSIAETFEFEEANVNRKKRSKAQRRLGMLGGRAGREREPPHIYAMAKEMINSGARRSISRSEATANNTQIIET